MYFTTEKPKHSAAQQQKWHLALSAYMPLKSLVHPHSPSEKSRFSCQDVMLPFGLMRTGVFSALDSLNWLNSHEPTNWFVKYCPLLFVCFYGCLVFVWHVAPFWKHLVSIKQGLPLPSSKGLIFISCISFWGFLVEITTGFFIFWIRARRYMCYVVRCVLVQQYPFLGHIVARLSFGSLCLFSLVLYVIFSWLAHFWASLCCPLW